MLESSPLFSRARFFDIYRVKPSIISSLHAGDLNRFTPKAQVVSATDYPNQGTGYSFNIYQKKLNILKKGRRSSN